MNRTKRIKKILKNHLLDFNINIVNNSDLHIGHNNFDGNGETHIMVILKRNTNLKVNRLEIHKKINNLLKDEFNKGLHSLEIKII